MLEDLAVFWPIFTQWTRKVMFLSIFNPSKFPISWHFQKAHDCHDQIWTNICSNKKLASSKPPRWFLTTCQGDKCQLIFLMSMMNQFRILKDPPHLLRKTHYRPHSGTQSLPWVVERWALTASIFIALPVASGLMSAVVPWRLCMVKEPSFKSDPYPMSHSVSETSQLLGWLDWILSFL